MGGNPEGRAKGGVARWANVPLAERKKRMAEVSAKVKNRYRPSPEKAKEMVRLREEKRNANKQTTEDSSSQSKS